MKICKTLIGLFAVATAACGSAAPADDDVASAQAIEGAPAPLTCNGLQPVRAGTMTGSMTGGGFPPGGDPGQQTFGYWFGNATLEPQVVTFTSEDGLGLAPSAVSVPAMSCATGEVLVRWANAECGTFDATFEGGAVTNTIWVVRPYCDPRSGLHPVCTFDLRSTCECERGEGECSSF